MDTETIISLCFAGVNFLLAVGITIKNCVVAIKTKNWEKLKEELTTITIPLMEQAEKMFADANEKRNWVVKKVGEEKHLDWFKHKNILGLELDIISGICETTKIEVNKNIIKQEKEETKQDVGGYTNGVC